MVTVAIAGTGHIGSHVAKAILATKKYDVIILSRSASIPELEKLGAKVMQVSYDDPASLDRALTGVHTVISTVSSMTDYTVFASAQLPLIDAAVRAGVTRFAPSEFNIRAYHDDPLAVYRPKAVVADHVRKSGLKYTFFETGLYMNFLGGGKDGSGVDHLPGLPIDIVAGKARVPGDGTSRVAWTRVQDIAAYVAASLDLEEWPEVSRLAGDIISWNDLIALAETVRGMPGRSFVPMSNAECRPRHEVRCDLSTERAT